MLTLLLLKRIGNYLGGIFLALCCMFGSFDAFQNGTADMNGLSRYTGRITEKGIAVNSSSISGRWNVHSDVFYVRLDGLDQTLAVYNPKRSYSDLDRKLKIGDTIKAYFKNTYRSSGLNTDVYRLEKNGIIVLNEDSYKFRSKLVAFISIAGGFLLLYLTFHHDRKYRRRKTTETTHNKSLHNE